MYHVLREVDDKIFVYDDSDGTLEFVDKSLLLDNQELEYVGMTPDGVVERDICIVDMQDCNFEHGTNIWDACESIEVIGKDDNDFDIFEMLSGGHVYRFKETYGGHLLFTSNIIVNVTDELMSVLGEFLSDEE